MAGKIIADQIEHSTAGSLDTSYVVNGSAKAFANIDGLASTPVSRKSLNVSSITDDGDGQYDTVFTNSFNDTSYLPFGNAKENVTGSRSSDVDTAFQSARTPLTTSTCEWLAMSFAGAHADKHSAYAVVYGDLA
jgi:hypothetical protein